jgi:acetylornithine deacetylase/succinyl-diaminopimelate desuccinylase-like protein
VKAAVLGLLGMVWLGTAAAATPQTVRAEARRIFADLIAFDTAAGNDQVPALAAYLSEQFRAAGFAAADIHLLPLGETASLVVRLRGDGSGGRALLLLGHMDVVPADPRDWQRDPFTLVEENGYFYGRGTEDVKADVTTISTTLMRLRRDGFVPVRDVVAVFTGDEETAQATTQDLLDHHFELVDAELALNGDGGGGVLDDATGRPLFYYLQGAEKAYATFALTARNPGGHSSEPRIDNAIYELSDALRALQGYRFPVMANDWTRGGLAAAGAATPGPVGTALTRFAADPGDAAAAELLWQQPTYVGRTRTTCVATMLAAGHAENALPQRATATVNCRIFPGTATAAVQAELQRVAGPKIDVTLAGRAFDSAASPLRDDVVAAVANAVHASYPDVPIVPDQASYYTDGSFFRAAGIPTYGVSSLFQKPSDSFAHGLNERVRTDAFYRGLEHWYALITQLAGPSH